MLNFERILCPVDFSEFSVRAYDYARSLAQHYGAELYVEHVIPPLIAAYPYYALPDSFDGVSWNLRTDAEKHLREFTESHNRNGLNPKLVIEEGQIPQSILSLASEKSIDLIVMGTHGWQGMDHFLLGSVAEKILRKAKCPVLVVRRPVTGFVKPPGSPDPVQLRKILYCTDFSEHSERALGYALSLALEYNAELTLLHVLERIPPPEDLQSVTLTMTRKLEAMIPPEAAQWASTKSAVRLGAPYQEIIQLGLESKADLIIMGVRGRNALDLTLFGSTTHRVLQLGSCPVLAVHV